ncbi:MAG: hypothetical protein HFJ60_05590 [Clostridia bacterium]|jgi:type II secretory pathway pseudopilin PulG|nr:hypothetical protein [Clostridia bacterium]
MKKQNKGITLVALVITIIILLILAGISISALTGSGLFQKAGDAKNSYEEAERRENSILGEYENYIDNLGNGGSTGSLPSNAETTPYLPDSSSKIIENSNLETGLVVADKNNNEWVWIVVPKSVTASATTDLEIENALQTYATDYRSSWTDEWYEGCGLTEAQYNENKSKMLQSIKANGGFWISRYEAGIEGSVQNPSLARTEPGELTTSSPKAVSKPDHIPYNWVTCSQAQNLASQMSPETTKTSSLLFGIQWDLVCKYLEGKDGLTTADINEDSSSWGNYSNNSLNITSAKAMGAEFNTSTYQLGEWQNVTEKPANKLSLLTTGASIGTKKMNIYNFASNEAECTLEKATSSSDPCSIRGGIYSLTGSDYPASARNDYDPSSGNDVIGLRVSLY